LSIYFAGFGFQFIDKDYIMSDEIDEKKAAKHLLDVMELQGISCATVSNGHLIMFKRTWLQALLDQHPGKESISMFLERPDFKKAN
jgi:hypothetical protein